MGRWEGGMLSARRCSPVRSVRYDHRGHEGHAVCSGSIMKYQLVSTSLVFGLIELHELCETYILTPPRFVVFIWRRVISDLLISALVGSSHNYWQDTAGEITRGSTQCDLYFYD